MQVGEKERAHNQSSLWREIATLVAEKAVNPETQTPYSVGLVEKAMTEAGFSIKTDKSAKSQVRMVCVNRASFNLHHSRSLPALNTYKTIQNFQSRGRECVCA